MATKRKEHPKKNQNDNKTHCVNGHEFTTENTWVHSDNSRHCRECGRVAQSVYREKNKEAIRENQRTMRVEMLDKGLVFPSHTPEAKRRTSLGYLGWTLEGFDAAFLQQEHKCAICDKSLNLDKIQNDSRACADHEHCEPPKPRGILCTVCNAGIGHFRDNPEFLRKAATYLEKFC